MNGMCNNEPVNKDSGYNMTQEKVFNKSHFVETTELITILGERIRLARKRRGLTMEEMASRMLVTRKTLARLEKGESGVSLTVLMSALWVLGLENDFKKLADPERDKVGIFHERKRLPKRVRSAQTDQYDELNF